MIGSMKLKLHTRYGRDEREGEIFLSDHVMICKMTIVSGYNTYDAHHSLNPNIL